MERNEGENLARSVDVVPSFGTDNTLSDRFALVFNAARSAFCRVGGIVLKSSVDHRGQMEELAVSGNFLSIANMRVDDKNPRVLRHAARDVLEEHVDEINDPEVLVIVALYSGNFDVRMRVVAKLEKAGYRKGLHQIWLMNVPANYSDVNVSREALLAVQRISSISESK